MRSAAIAVVVLALASASAAATEAWGLDVFDGRPPGHSLSRALIDTFPSPG